MPPPPRRSGSGALIALLVGGGLVLVIIIAVVVVVLTSKDEKSPKEYLNAAADSLSTARTVTLKGTLSSGARPMSGELTVTKGGRASGPVTLDGTSLTLLAVDGKVYAKADSSYWRTESSLSTTPYFLKSGEQWGRLNASKMTLETRQVTPSALTSKLRTAAFRTKLKPTKTTVQGRKALKFNSGLTTIYLTDSDSPVLLRYEDVYPRIAVDVTPKTTGEAINDMREQIGELKDSFDGSVRPTVVEWKKGLCSENSSGCSVRGKVRAITSSVSPVRVEVRYRLTGGTISGKDLGDCKTTVTLSGSDGTWAECRVATSEWAAWSRGDNSRYYHHPEFRVEGASSTEIQTMQSGLASD
ncbi:hypothetical protein [Spirillospora sp. CA-294931]|uniref:hypothetical protein n=1 Tax=Spirillospora sp. CA-294931 TaxID=3240042 RepID=UPI003D8ED2F8